jgi:hypothetical protein
MLSRGCVQAVLSLGQLSMLFGDCRCNVVGFVLNKRSLGSKILIALDSRAMACRLSPTTDIYFYRNSANLRFAPAWSWILLLSRCTCRNIPSKHPFPDKRKQNHHVIAMHWYIGIFHYYDVLLRHTSRNYYSTPPFITVCHCEKSSRPYGVLAFLNQRNPRAISIFEPRDSIIF